MPEGLGRYSHDFFGISDPKGPNGHAARQGILNPLEPKQLMPLTV